MNSQKNINAEDLTITIPLDFNRRGLDLLYRVNLFKKKLGNGTFKIIFGVNSSPNFHFTIFKNIIKNCSNFSFASELCLDSHLSKLRNIALNQVKTSHVLFLDIDIYPDIEMLEHVLLKLSNSELDLVMYPCLYLSKKGNRLISKKNAETLTDAYFDYRRDLIKHLAFPSSIIACDLNSILEISGFDENFIGYAYEDLDFMIRLFHKKELLNYNSELLIDEAYLAPMMSTGFRAVLAEPFLDRILEKKYFMHLFHKKDPKQAYYKAKQNNRVLFLEKLNRNILDKNEPILHGYRLIKYIEHFKKQDSDYSVLWSEIEGHKFR